MTAGGRLALRYTMLHLSLIAAHQDPSLRPFADLLHEAVKPHRVLITGIATMPTTSATVLWKNRQHRVAATF